MMEECLVKSGYQLLAYAGCCFIKYASSEEADRAIGALHNQYTLPGVYIHIFCNFPCAPICLIYSSVIQAAGPIQVRYADGERERLGTLL